MNDKNTIEIRFGAMSPKLHEQLDVPPSKVELEQRLADAIVLCYIHLDLSENQVNILHKKLLKVLIEKMVEYDKRK